MPRAHKRKGRAPKKSRHTGQDPQAHRAAQGGTELAEEPSSSSPVLEDIPRSSSAAVSGTPPPRPSSPPSTSTTSGRVPDTRPHEGDDSQGEEEQQPPSSGVTPSADRSHSDALATKVDLLEQFLLYKYKMKQPIMKADMLMVVNTKCPHLFAEILQGASRSIEALFAVEVKEINSTCQSYDLVSKLKLPNNGRVRPGRGLPKTGLLMTLLGVIFMKGNRATEEDVWKFLNTMRIYAGRKHFIYGEPRKLITKDLVRLQYLEYRRLPDTDPARYEFLWGPKAHAETSKMKVLEFVAKARDTVPTAFPSQYEEALRDQEERARVGTAATPGATARARLRSCTCPAASSLLLKSKDICYPEENLSHHDRSCL
uniref:MAGE domain-containing protein n=1 Tax=Oryctolagus cuniculus TaxID=9986 RepID=U3KLU3_RABIT